MGIFDDISAILKDPSEEQELVITGTAVSIGGAISNAFSTYNAAKADAETAAFKRGASIYSTQQKIIELRRQAQRTFGSIRAAAGANGIQMTGSALDILEQSAFLADVDIQRAQIAGDLEEKGFKMEQKNQTRRAGAAIGGGIVASGGFALSGAKDLLKLS